MSAFFVFLGFALMVGTFIYGGATGEPFWWVISAIAAMGTATAGGPDP